MKEQSSNMSDEVRHYDKVKEAGEAKQAASEAKQETGEQPQS